MDSSDMNFDIPPATRSSTRSSTSESRSARHLLHQRIREFNTIREERANLLHNEGHRVPRRPSFDVRTQTPAPPPAVGGSTRSSLRRHRSGPWSELPRLMEQMRGARPEADSLLEQPIPRIGSPDVATTEYLGEAEVNRQRKRRKIDHAGHHPGVGMNGFRYGSKGTSTPGPLKMEMISCDGGLMHTEVPRIGREYGPANVLRNDKSVYCTNANANRCNIIIRHIHEATFTLSKIVIKAPEKGFTAPVQEGLIFITMSLDGLLPRTAAYRVRDSSAQPKNSASKDEENQRPPSRRRDSTSRSIPPPISHITPSTFDPSDTYFHDRRLSATTFAQLPLDAPEPPPSDASRAAQFSTTTITTTPPPLVPGFDITTHCDTPSSDEEEPSSAATLADRQRRDLAPPPYVDVDHSSDSEDTEEGIERALEARALRIPPQSLHRASRRYFTRLPEPSIIECRVPSLDQKLQASANQDGELTISRLLSQQQQEKSNHQQQPRAPQILPPNARFFIEPEKNVVSLKFEPEVTGKYILLKLWSPKPGDNIDIQSITVHGYAGPRSFPGTTMV